MFISVDELINSAVLNALVQCSLQLFIRVKKKQWIKLISKIIRFSISI